MDNSDPERTERWLKQTTQLLSSNLRAGHTRVLTAQIRFTDCLVQLQKFEEAEAFLLLVLEYTGDRDDETYTTIKNKHNKHFYTLGMRSEFIFLTYRQKRL